MFETTWPEVVEIAKRRATHTLPIPLFVVCNGAKGDFASLQSFGVVGTVATDGERWFVDTGGAHIYLHAHATVWVA